MILAALTAPAIGTCSKNKIIGAFAKPLLSSFKKSFIFLLLISALPGIAQESTPEKEVSHVFYLTANTGNSEKFNILESISEASKEGDSASVLLLGNFTRNGFAPEEKDREQDKEFLRKDLLEPLEDFNGRLIFTPGVNEWNKAAPESIDDLESFLQDNSHSEFWPSDGCPLKNEEIGDNIVLITVDSQWFLEDWDKHLEMNSGCDLKTREDFFVEFKDDLKDSQGKIAIVAIHHPVMSNTKTPFFERIIAAGEQAYDGEEYKELRGRLETLASLYDDVIFVSGAGENLQLIDNGRNVQIISGAASETEAVKNADEGNFASEEEGFAKLIVYKDGSSKVEFYEFDDLQPNLIFSRKIERERPDFEDLDFEFGEERISEIAASVYTPEETDKSSFYEWLWGDKYREVYSKNIVAPTLYLDSLPGNVKPIAVGGGQQSRSLRLISDNENEYTLRALRKDPLQYIQADLVPEAYIQEFLDSTYAERFIGDFFTAAHPYAPFAVNNLSKEIGMLHVNPEIYYVPKQPGLGIYNREYGDELYMFEAHVGAENKDFENFGASEDILSTADLVLELRESKESYVDQDEYIKARLFDMLIGDWDRHQDQWRWAQYSEDGRKRYVPIPRDRDHAFPKYDGAMMSILKGAVPILRKMQSYDKDIANIERFNWSGYPLDQRFVTTADWEVWEEQVNYIQENLTDAKIEAAFESLPEEIQDQNIEDIKAALLARRENLPEIARRYYNYLQEFQVLTGTAEDNLVKIQRKPNGVTEISIFQEEEEIFSEEYSSEETDEIWIYGLDGDDTFEVSGQGDDLIKLKVLGGDEEDIYDFSNPKQVKLYDYESEETTITNPASNKWLVDSYEINEYLYTKRKYAENSIVPTAGFEPDAGFTLGIKDVYTTYGLALNPFSSQYVFGAKYFFATNGFSLGASAEYAHVFYKWNFRLETYYSSPNYLINFFGRGNGSEYLRDIVNFSYNRVKMEEWYVAPSLRWLEGSSGFYFKPMLESIEVHPMESSYLTDFFSPDNDIFDRQLYAGAEANYHYFSKNNKSFPSLGSELDFTMGYKQNIDGHDNEFGYLKPSFSFDYPLHESGFVVLATRMGGEVILGDDYEFYHAATLGGNNSLRGYRNHRFNGQRSFFHSTDIRSALGLLKTSFIPLIYGVTAGFDYGRVWIDEEEYGEWHSNYGGSVWLNGLYAMTANLGFYHGDDGNRWTFTLNFKF